METPLGRRVVAEFIGTGMLVAAVVGSGIMAERLAGGNDAVALLANTVATGAVLFALIVTFAGTSGAHFNPVVTLVALLNRSVDIKTAAAYAAVQVAGGIAGTAAANAMFGLPVLFASTKVRTGPAQWFAELIATFGLVAVITAASRQRRSVSVIAACVAAYITAAYWFTASTSFANPAVTIARSLTDTFAGIRPADAPAFIVAQVAGGVAAGVLFNWLIQIEEK